MNVIFMDINKLMGGGANRLLTNCLSNATTIEMVVA